MRLLVTTLILYFIISCDPKTETSDPVLFSPDILSTRDFNESISYMDMDQQVVYITRADKAYETSTILISDRNGEVFSKPVAARFSGQYYDAGVAFTPDNMILFTSKRPTMNDSITDEWNIWETPLNPNSNDQPQLAGHPINTNSSECCLVMNTDGVTYFASERDGSWDIFRVQYESGNWSQFEKVEELSTENDEWPSYVNDQEELILLSSIRKTGHGGDDIYYSQRLRGEWQRPILLDTAVNSKKYEDSASLDDDGYLYYSSSKDSDFSAGVSNIYRVKFSSIKSD